ncbi:AAA family ATPase [Egibacter rhizosphaerae]|nr:AAA family ATPase [Egibacter rhizosphaerae]
MTMAAEHVARPHLRQALLRTRISAVIAGAGYGKTALAAELLETHECPAARVRVRQDAADAHQLLESVRQALARARLEEASEILDATAADPSGLADALHDGLVEVSEPTLLLVDDAQRLQDDAARYLREAIEELPEPHVVVLCARWLPPELRPLSERPDATLLSSDDLAFSEAEIAELGRAYGLDLSEDDAGLLRRTTAGWPAALRMLLPALPAEDTGAAIQRHAQEPATLGALTESALGRLRPEDRDLVVQLAHLPLLDGPLTDRVAGRAGTLDTLAAAGLPLTPTRDGWWTITDPVRDQLVGRASLDTSTAETAARAYDLREERRAAVWVLLRAGCEERAVATAGSWSSQAAVQLGPEPLQRLCGSVSDAALRRDPRVLVHLSRACRHAHDIEGSHAALERAEALPPDPAMADEVEAERILAEMYQGREDDVHERAEELLARTDTDRPVVRAKALQAVARITASSREEADLRRADGLLAEAMGIWDRLGESSLLAQVALFRGLVVAWPLGRHEDAITYLDTALANAGAFSQQRANALPFLGYVLTYAGRHEEADRCFAETARLGERLQDRTAQVYAQWGFARSASHRGDAPGTVRAVDEALRLAGDRFVDTSGGAYLLADLAQLLDRVGEVDRAWDLLARADTADTGTLGLVPLAAFALHARSGDPQRAEDYLEEAVQRPALEPRERWRVALLRAEAARRRGARDDAAAHVRDALERAEATDVPDAPWIREARLAAQLAPLVTSEPADEPSPRTVVRLFDGFRVDHAGHDATPPDGRLAALVKIVALQGGSASSEQVIEALWPETDPHAGRQRLRRVLARLRRECADLVTRDGDRLTLPEGATIDHAAFVEAAREALHGSTGSREGARIALGLAGDLLPDNRGEEWVEPARREVARLRLALLDQVATAAAESGDADEAARLFGDAIAIAPFDTARHDRAAGLLEAAGRSAQAEALRRRARTAAWEDGATG